MTATDFNALLIQNELPKNIAQQVTDIIFNSSSSSKEKWQEVTQLIKNMDVSPHTLQIIYNTIKPSYAWYPSENSIHTANVTKVAKDLNLSGYKELYEWSITHRTEFWDYIIKKLKIQFRKPYQEIADFSKGIEQPMWLPGAEFNIIDSCFQADEHQAAIIWQKEDDKKQYSITYQGLQKYVNRIANGLIQQGIKKGDTIGICMPMTMEAVAIYLAIVKAGGVVISIADSLAPPEIEKRLKIAQARLLVTQDVILRGGKEIPLYTRILEINPPTTIVLPAQNEIKQTLREQDIAWNVFLSNKDTFDSVVCRSSDYCNILFSSGTTGEPKAIPWSHTTPIKCAADGYLHHNIQAGDVVAWPTNIGWMMGPWLIFAGLINKATIALYYGSPLGRDFGEFVHNTKVNMLGLVPSMVKKWIETDCMKGLDWSSIKVFSSTGESSNPTHYLWLMARGGFKPVIEYCGGTEIGGGFATGTVVQPANPSTFTTPALGLDLVILDENNNQSNKGELFIIPPSIGLSTTLLNKDHYEAYYQDTPNVNDRMTGVSGIPIKKQLPSEHLKPILRKHGDEFERLPDGYLRAHGRADDTMNLGGIKVSSIEIERLLDLQEEVKETAAVAVPPQGGGPEELVIFAVPVDKSTINLHHLKEKFQKVIKSQLNPLFHIKEILLIDELPRTASNKIMRRILKQHYLEQNLQNR